MTNDTLQAKSVPIRYIPPLERLTEQDRIDLADWVRSKKTSPFFAAVGWKTEFRDGYDVAVKDYEQALLADLEEK